MERYRQEPPQQLQPPQIPLRCPRCGSLDTRFRYFNNLSRAQPRYHCYSCKRQWTFGGSLRNVPIGGRPRIGKPIKASSSTGGGPISQPPQPLLSEGEGHQQSSRSTTAMAAMFSQNFDTTMSQSVTNLPASPWDAYYFNNEISCLDAIQSLIQPEIDIQHVNAGNHIINVAAYATIPQGWNVQTMASQEAAQFRTTGTMESYQTHNGDINIHSPPSHWYSNNIVQQSMNLPSLDAANDVSFTASDALSWNNFNANATNTQDTSYVNIDEWLNFSGDENPP